MPNKKMRTVAFVPWCTKHLFQVLGFLERAVYYGGVGGREEGMKGYDNLYMATVLWFKEQGKTLLGKQP